MVDDVRTAIDVRAFSIRSAGCAILFTGRKASSFQLNNVPVTNIKLLDELEAEELFRAYARIADNVTLNDVQRKILGHCNRHPLGVAVAGSMVGRHPMRADLILERFDRADVSKIVAAIPEYRRSSDYPGQETSLFRVLLTSFELLDDREKNFLGHFAIFPEDTHIPIVAIELLGPMANLNGLEIEECVENLDDAALFTFHRNVEKPLLSYVTLHDLQRDFIVCQSNDNRKRHAAIVETFRDRYGKLYAEGADYPSYLRRFMVYHLLRGGHDGRSARVVD